MILSKSLHPSDYDSLVFDLQRVNGVVGILGGWDPVQHYHRKWEYALASHAFDAHFGERNHLKVADFGCGIGLLSPIMIGLSSVDEVSLYEVWVYGNEEAKATRQMGSVIQALLLNKPWRMVNRPLCELTDADRGYDACYCISTLEHIGEYQRAFTDMCRSVAPRGMLFLTTDFAEHEQDHYRHANLRAGRMFTRGIYEELVQIGQSEGLELPTETDWSWSEEHRTVNDYGFASLCMVRP